MLRTRESTQLLLGQALIFLFVVTLSSTALAQAAAPGQQPSAFASLLPMAEGRQ